MVSMADSHHYHPSRCYGNPPGSPALSYFIRLAQKMEKEDAIGETPSLDGPSGAVKSAVGVNDLANSIADNNRDDAVTSPLSAAPKKRLFRSNKRQSTTSPSQSPKGKAQKKKKETKYSLQHGQTAQGRRNSARSTKGLKNVTNVKAKERPSSPSDSPIKAKNLNNLVFEPSPIQTQPSHQPKKKDGFKITSTVILERLRPDDIFGGRVIASENVYDADDMAEHDEPFSKAAISKFGHDKISLSKVNDGYLTNNFSKLSRLLLEDVLVQYNGDNEHTSSFRVLISTPPTSQQTSASNAHLSAIQNLASKIYWHQQRHGGLGVHKREIMGTKYHELYATLTPNKNHRAIKEGQLTMDEIRELLNGDGGFELRFEGTPSSMASIKIKWSDMVEYPSDIMIFGKQSTAIRSFDRLFRGKSTLDYIHHIYRQFSLEVRGDTEASLALIVAYQTRRLIVSTESEKISNTNTERSLIASMSFLGEEQSEFFQRVDDTFKGAIKTSLATFQVYNEPIVCRERMIELMEEAQAKFPIVWKALDNMRGVSARSRASHLLQYGVSR